MAKILLGAALGDARGSVGAHTFTKGRFGAVLRQKVSPVQPRSSSVMNVRALFQTLSKNWANTLTDLQRAGWNALAAITSYTNVFGNTYHPTGLQLYQSCNRNLQMSGAALISAAPPNLNVDTPLTITGAASAGGATFTAAYTPTPVPADHVFFVSASPQLNRGRSFIGGNYKKLAAVGAGVASPFDIYTYFSALYGTLSLGQKIGIKGWFINVTNGSASQAVSEIVTVAA